MVHDAPHVPVLLDCSVSLINRTGAHFIAQDLAEALSGMAVVRRYRLLGRELPRGIVRKLLGRLMLRELRHATHVAQLPWPEPADPRLKRIFLDPLYVLRSRLTRDDVVLCHDVGPVSHPALYDAETSRLYGAAYAKIARAQPGMVFVSEASRTAFTALYGRAYRYLRVIPLYVREGAEAGEEAPVPGLGARFFLTVGALERRKNQRAAIEGFAASGLAREGYRYVLCGARGDGCDALLARARETEGVDVLGYVSDAQLRYLYRHAAAFVLPSLLEGFGMPALEAAQYGLVPILSRDSALTEAVGGLCVAVDPHSPASLAAAMREVAELDASRRRDLRAALIAHASSASRARFLGAWLELFNAEARPAPALERATSASHHQRAR